MTAPPLDHAFVPCDCPDLCMLMHDTNCHHPVDHGAPRLQACGLSAERHAVAPVVAQEPFPDEESFKPPMMVKPVTKPLKQLKRTPSPSEAQKIAEPSEEAKQLAEKIHDHYCVAECRGHHPFAIPFAREIQALVDRDRAKRRAEDDNKRSALYLRAEKAEVDLADCAAEIARVEQIGSENVEALLVRIGELERALARLLYSWTAPLNTVWQEAEAVLKRGIHAAKPQDVEAPLKQIEDLKQDAHVNTLAIAHLRAKLAAAEKALADEREARSRCIFDGCDDDAKCTYPVCYNHRQYAYAKGKNASLTLARAEGFRDGLEVAAKKAEKYFTRKRTNQAYELRRTGYIIAAAIRALVPEEPKKEEV